MERQLNATTADFIAELVRQDVESRLKPNEFTISDYRAEHKRQTGEDMAKHTAETRLKRLEKAGKVTRRQELVFHNGREVIAYRMVDGTENETPI